MAPRLLSARPVLPSSPRKRPFSPWLWLLLGPLLAACLVFAPNLRGGAADSEPSSNAFGATAGAVSPLRAGLAMAGVLTLAVAGLLVWRRARGPSAAGKDGRTLRCLESLRLSPKHRVHLLACGEELLVLGEGDAGVVLLHRPDSTLEEAPTLGAPPARARRQNEADLDIVIDDDELAPLKETAGAVPRDLVLEPVPRRERATANQDQERFRKLLDQVRAEVRA